MATRRQPSRPAPPRLPAPSGPAPFPAPAALAPVERLRTTRLRARPDPSLAADMDRELRELTRHRRAIGGTSTLWSQIVPPALAQRTTLEGIARGVLTVRVPDAATSFELDRFLRAGGQRALTSQSRISITRIRIVVKR